MPLDQNDFELLKQVWDASRLHLKLEGQEVLMRMAEEMGVGFVGKEMFEILSRAGECQRDELGSVKEELNVLMSEWPESDDALDVFEISTKSIINARKGFQRLKEFEGPVFVQSQKRRLGPK